MQYRKAILDGRNRLFKIHLKLSNSKNDNEPIELLISFAIAFDLGSNNGDATTTIDFGNIALKNRPVDDNWKSNVVY